VAAYYRDRALSEQPISLYNCTHIYRDRQSSTGNEEPSEKLIQQRGRGAEGEVRNGMEHREGGWCRDWSEAGTASGQTEGKAFNSLRRLKK